MTKTMQLPKQQEEEEPERSYSESNVKKILYGFARGLGDKRPAKELRSIIDRVFDFKTPKVGEKKCVTIKFKNQEERK